VDVVRRLRGFDADLAAKAGEVQHSQSSSRRAARLVVTVREE
jgi:hypothetical protein